MITREAFEKKYGNDPGKKNVFINFDAIDALPEYLEPAFSELKFNPAKLEEFFSNVGTKKNPSWYPRTETMYKIAEMQGITGESTKTVEWIWEEVDINIILIKPLDAEPTMRKIKTAARVTKQSKILCEDNTYRLSSPETNEFKIFARACIEFLNEEEETENYTKQDKWPDGNKKKYKYDTTIKRQRRLLELEKFAVEQAETKAFCKTVRVLTGLPTGFQTKDLQSGVLVFCKYVKSKRLQKLEIAAQIDAIRQGNTQQIQDTSSLLFGDKQIEPPVAENEIFDVQEAPSEPQVDEKTKIKNIMQQYLDENEEAIIKVANAKDTIVHYIQEYERLDIEKLKEMLKRIEEKIKGIKIIDHDIFNDNEEKEIF